MRLLFPDEIVNMTEALEEIHIAIQVCILKLSLLPEEDPVSIVVWRWTLPKSIPSSRAF